jgi:hypothetical protein
LLLFYFYNSDLFLTSKRFVKSKYVSKYEHFSNIFF